MRSRIRKRDPCSWKKNIYKINKEAEKEYIARNGHVTRYISERNARKSLGTYKCTEHVLHGDTCMNRQQFWELKT